MTPFHTFMVGLGLCLASMMPPLDDSTVTPQFMPPPGGGGGGSLTWTTDTQSFPGGNWDSATQAAAAHVGQGYSDWRLPTVAELQAALQPTSGGGPPPWGLDLLNPGGTGRGWTSRTSGNYAYAVVIATNMDGTVIPSQSGQSVKLLKGSNLARTKFVRP